ncbi:PHD finger protein 10 [Boothiomyces sp. JEL0866]|nr:PHD finger protein 10 [Boothiomyces sp. JEL0866]
MGDRKRSPKKKEDDDDDYEEEIEQEPPKRGRKKKVEEEMEVDQDFEDEETQEENEEEEEPPEPQEQPKRKRGRPPIPKKKGRPPKPKQSTPPPDEETDDEEVDSETDPIGETKIDKDGYLQGGREYRFPTFTLPRHPTRLYLYSLEASKLLGFRDTYIFFLRNTNVKRVNGTEEDREHLRKLDILPSQLRNRPITLIRARNLFKVFGHKVVRRGRPIKDDYFVGDQQETAEDDTKMDEDEQSYGIYDYSKTSGGDRGPFRRHDFSIAGFLKPKHEVEQFEPLAIPAELEQDQWMLKCALSAADFNQRLNKTRPTSFLDLHTNIEQVPKITQPIRVLVETNIDYTGNEIKIEKEVNCRPYEPHTQWQVVGNSFEPSKYPLAIMKDQHQDAVPLYQNRFSETDSPYYNNENINEKRIRQYDQPPNLYGVQPFIMASQPPQILSVRKKGRPRKVKFDQTGDEEACAHCHELSSAASLKGVPGTLMITCDKCKTNHHPSCMEFEDPVLISKCFTYPWLCSNCKTCTKCNTADNDDKLLFCDVCDRGLHTYCNDPPLQRLPEGAWLCKLCAECQSCKTTKPGPTEWRHVVIPQKGDVGQFLATFCPSCYNDFQQDRFCPICLKVYSRDADDLAMVCCDSCDRWIHVGCDDELTEKEYQRLVEQEEPQFTCILCDPIRVTRALESTGAKEVEYKGQILITPSLK